MNIVCCGLSHRTAQVDVRERFAFGGLELPAALRGLTATAGVREGVILSTCNRVEHYAVLEGDLAGDPERGRRLAETFFWRRREEQGCAGGIDGAQFFHVDGPRAVEHLFRVACGLESMVLGETEILGQVKQAYTAALEAGATGRTLNKLFQRAFQAAKQARSRTCIGRGSVSVASAAADLAEKLFGDLAGCQTLVLGAGEIGAGAARSLLARGMRRLLVANRTPARAAALAAELGGQAASFTRWDAEARDIDILVTSTSAPGLVVSRDQLAGLMRDRADRPLFVIDLAVPRNVEPSANDLEGVYLYDIDSLREISEQAMASRRQEVEACERIIAGHVREFIAWHEREAARRAGGEWPAALPVGSAVGR